MNEAKNLLPCLSIRQPYAWLIIRPQLTDPYLRAHAIAAGKLKDVENRLRRSHYRGPLLIHASAGGTRQYRLTASIQAKQLHGVTVKEDELQFGGVIGIVEMTGCLDRPGASKWFTGPFGYVFENPRPLPFRPLKARLGMFNVEWEAR